MPSLAAYSMLFILLAASMVASVYTDTPSPEQSHLDRQAALDDVLAKISQCTELPPVCFKKLSGIFHKLSKQSKPDSSSASSAFPDREAIQELDKAIWDLLTKSESPDSPDCLKHTLNCTKVKLRRLRNHGLGAL